MTPATAPRVLTTRHTAAVSRRGLRPMWGSPPTQWIAPCRARWWRLCIRCRAAVGGWDGNASINNRLGKAITPFVDAEVVATTLPLPLPLKDHGRLQAAIIARADAALAAHSSAYGHTFLQPPPRRRVLSNWATYLRPPALRARMFRLRRRPLAPPPALTPERLSTVLGGTPEIMPRFFRLSRMRDAGQLNRAMTLELLFRRLCAVDA